MISVAFVFALVVASAAGKTYERCELARELMYEHGVPEHEIATWVCIAEHESQYNTSAVGSLNGDGSNDHGLFQISDLFWCSNSGSGKACDLPCSDLEDDNIEDDLDCVRRIHKEHTTLSGDGFNAWAVYKPHCKGPKADKYVEDCFTAADVPASPKKKTTTKKVYPWQVSTTKSYSHCSNQVQLQGKVASSLEELSKPAVFSTSETPVFGSVSPHLSTTVRQFPMFSSIAPTVAVTGVTHPTTTYRGFPRFATVSPALSTLYKAISPSSGFVSSTPVPVQTVYTFPSTQNRFYSSTSSRPSHQLRESNFANAPFPVARQINPRPTFIINGAAWL